MDGEFAHCPGGDFVGALFVRVSTNRMWRAVRCLTELQCKDPAGKVLEMVFDVGFGRFLAGLWPSSPSWFPA